MTQPFLPVSPNLSRIRRVTAPALLLAAVLVVPWDATATRAAQLPAVRGEHAMAVTPEAHATRTAIRVLHDGGNAIDAAVAASFVLAVTFPQAGNLAGGGFLLYRDGDGRYHALDFRERAPAALEAGDFLDEDDRPIPGLSLRGGLSVGVPGSVAGAAEMHRHWGTRPWNDLIEPAIRLAEDGFEVDPYLAECLARHADKLGAYPETRRVFFRAGRPLAAGARLRQPDLAASLRLVARRGAAGLYSGPLAEAIVRAVRDAGGVLALEDLTDYRAVSREPVAGRYRGHRVVSFPPPSSGGVALLQMLGMLERYDLAASGFGSSRTVHLVVEAERRAFADRSRWLGDPDFVDVPVEALLSPSYLAARAATIRPDRATPSAEVLPGRPLPPESPDTLHFSIADAGGRAVALTTTLNATFGNGMVAPGTGILLNNEIDDFSLATGVPNTYGLLGGAYNAVAGGKRPLSSMTPVIVERAGGGPRPLLVLGSPGGARIITSVLQVVLDVIDLDMPLEEAVGAPRFHHQWQPDTIVYEPRAFPADVLDKLGAMGHATEVSDEWLGNVNAIGLAADGAWLGAADPRRRGLAAGY